MQPINFFTPIQFSKIETAFPNSCYVEFFDEYFKYFNWNHYSVCVISTIHREQSSPVLLVDTSTTSIVRHPIVELAIRVSYLSIVIPAIMLIGKWICRRHLQALLVPQPHEKVCLDAEQMGWLKIKPSGTSDLPNLQKIKFKIQYLSDNRFSCIRLLEEESQKTSIEINSLSISLDGYLAQKLKAAALDKHSEILYAIQNLPHALNAGCIGKIYPIRIGEENLVFKLQNFFQHTSDEDYRLETSLNYALENAYWFRQLEKTQHLIQYRGIIFIEELKVWGLLYKKIEGRDLLDYFNSLKHLPFNERYGLSLALMTGVAEALEELDRVKHSQTDLKPDNIMIEFSSDQPKGLVIDIDSNSPTKAGLVSRQQFAFIFYELLTRENGLTTNLYSDAYQQNSQEEKEMKKMELVKKGIPNEVVNLIVTCLDAQTNMQDLSWEKVRQILHQASSRL